MTQNTVHHHTMNIVDVVAFLHRNKRPRYALDLIHQVNDDCDPIICDHDGNMNVGYINWRLNDVKLFAQMQCEVTTTVWPEEDNYE